MSKFFDRMDRISDVIGGGSPDIKMEDAARFAGQDIPEPRWYRIFSRGIGPIGVLLAIIIIGVAYIFTGSRLYASIEGIHAILYLLIPAIGLIAIPLTAVAVIQRKLRFRETLPPDQKQIYTEATKKRVKDFIVLLGVGIIVTIVMAIVMILIYHYFIATKS